MRASERIGVINGLRGFSILAVIYHHLFYTVTPPGWLGVAGSALSNGWLGVNLFFVLSGFVLHLPYASGKRSFATRDDVLSFWRHRAARLLPLYYLSLFVAWSFTSRGRVLSPDFPRELLLMTTCTFTFTRDWWAPPVNWVLWSLGLEIWFSVLFPLVSSAALRLGAGRLFAAIAAVSLAVRFVGVAVPGADTGNVLLNPLKDSLPGRLDDFALGMWLAARFARGESWRGRFPPVVALAGGVGAVLAVCSLWDLVVLGRLTRFATPLLNDLFLAGAFLAVPALLAMTSGPIRFALANRPIQVIGMMTYSLYVWHGIVQVALGKSLTPSRLAVHGVLLGGLSLLTYRYVEFGRQRDARELFLLGGRDPDPLRAADEPERVPGQPPM